MVPAPIRYAEKQKNLEQLYHHDDAWIERRYQIRAQDVYELFRRKGSLKYFTGTHPQVMREKVAAQDWAFDPQIEQQWPAWVRPPK